MEQHEYQALLDALDQPAFFAADGILTCANAAFSKLQIPMNTPVASFFSGPEADADGGAFDCFVAGMPYRGKRISRGSGALYLLQSRDPGISTYALGHTAKSLRSMLHQMYNAIDLLDRRLPEEEQDLDGTLQSLLQGVFVLERMADNLDHLQRLKCGTYPLACQRMDLAALLRQLCEKAEALLREAGITLQWQVPDGAFLGAADRKLLSLIFWNLVSNAAANAQGGTVTVRVERLHLTKLRLKVTDSGTGIPASRQGELMQRYQVPPEDALDQHGLGVGLTLVRSAAQLLGGSFALSMEPGGKTTAAVLLDTNLPAEAELHSDVKIFARSLDEGLVGLADVLPRRLYDRKAILG